jgi:hypothetical protein
MVPLKKYTYYTVNHLFCSEKILLSSSIAVIETYTYPTVCHLFEMNKVPLPSFRVTPETKILHCLSPLLVRKILLPSLRF